MLVTVDTGYIDLVHNTEVLEAALDGLPAGWIVDLEFFKADTVSFVKTDDGWFITADSSFCCGDMQAFIQGDNPLGREAMSVSFHEPVPSDAARQQNKALEEAVNAKNGETLLDGRFVKYRDFFLDAGNGLRPVGLLAVANSLCSDMRG